MMYGREKSDSAIVAKKLANKAGLPAAEQVEPRAGTEGNAGQQRTRRAQNRESVSQKLERVRQAAKLRKKERFTALLHHVTVEFLEKAFYALRRRAAPGVDEQMRLPADADFYLAHWIALHALITGRKGKRLTGCAGKDGSDAGEKALIYGNLLLSQMSTI